LFYCIAQVFAYGSVALKTYLPDGDIDLTILGNTSHDSTLVNDVYCILDSEEQNSDAEFEVKNLDRINAEVCSAYTSFMFLIIHLGGHLCNS
jgi:DNA polymerase sigma